MPKPNKGESRQVYISRCVQQVKHEEPGKDIKACLGKCYGMWDEYSKPAKKESNGPVTSQS